MIQVTTNAARHLQALLAEKGALATEHGLRLLVERGGCAGMQYQMKIDTPASGDDIVTQDGVMFIVAADSKSFLNGCQIDYEDALSDSGFRIHNPNAVRSCGCGTSFEAAPELAATQPAAEPVPCGSEN